MRPKGSSRNGRRGVACDVTAGVAPGCITPVAVVGSAGGCAVAPIVPAGAATGMAGAPAPAAAEVCCQADTVCRAPASQPDGAADVYCEAGVGTPALQGAGAAGAAGVVVPPGFGPKPYFSSLETYLLVRSLICGRSTVKKKITNANERRTTILVICLLLCFCSASNSITTST